MTGTARSPRAVVRPGLIGIVFAVALCPALAGCVTVAEYRKLERAVIDLQRGQAGGQRPNEQIADLVAEVEATSAQIRTLSGRIDELQRTADEALSEARKARREASGAVGGAPPIANGTNSARAGGADAGSPGAASAGAAASGGTEAGFAAIVPGGDESDGGEGGSPDEIRAYQAGLTAWRANDYASCIDRFRAFLQTYASSSRADDAAFWIGDCHYRQGEFKQAVLRFDDVYLNYPTGNRAPDAVYRQGESLLKLGPAYHTAARKAFERVVNEYPDSARAVEARKQLKLRSPG